MANCLIATQFTWTRIHQQTLHSEQTACRIELRIGLESDDPKQLMTRDELRQNRRHSAVAWSKTTSDAESRSYVKYQPCYQNMFFKIDIKVWVDFRIA